LLVVESIKAIPIHQVRAWANQLAGEARDADWLRYSYVVPDVLNDVARELEQANRGLIGLVGRQGVGKSSALMALMKGIPFYRVQERVDRRLEYREDQQETQKRNDMKVQISVLIENILLNSLRGTKRYSLWPNTRARLSIS
jgi:ATPase subunit of ABC transporter with duplicated ATPase domains